VSEIPPSDIRIGDTEREQALKALGEHMSAGRLDLEEYGDRSAKIPSAKTRGDLTGLFTDLPEPRPTFGPSRPVVQPIFSEVEQQSQQAVPLARRLAGAVIPVVSILAVLLFLATKTWVVFLLIPATVIVAGGMLGEDPRRRRRGRR
jgi:hypothetical protein